MPTYPLVTGYSPGFPQNDGFNGYYVAIGDMDFHGFEPYSKLRARDSYTWANLAIRVNANTLTNACTAKSRVGGADGNMVITIGAGLTGLFQDAVNSDALVTGDLFNYKLITVAGGTDIDMTSWASTLTTVSNTTPIMCTSYTPGAIYAVNQTYYFAIVGMLKSDGTEGDIQYRSRVASVLSKLHSYIQINSLNVICTIRPRINGANVNSVLSIGAAATGLFEDAANTDAIAITDLVNYSLTSPAGSGTIKVAFISFQSDSSGQWIGEGVGDPSNGQFFGRTRYQVIQGNANGRSDSETPVQLPVQAVGTARNMMVHIETNDVNAATTFRIRKNGGNGNLSVSVPDSNTGIFEDLGNSDALITTDSWNWQIITGGVIGQIEPSIVALQFDPGAAPPPAGLGDKSAIMGAKMIGHKMI